MIFTPFYINHLYSKVGLTGIQPEQKRHLYDEAYATAIRNKFLIIDFVQQGSMYRIKFAAGENLEAAKRSADLFLHWDNDKLTSCIMSTIIEARVAILDANDPTYSVYAEKDRVHEIIGVIPVWREMFPDHTDLINELHSDLILSLLADSQVSSGV